MLLSEAGGQAMSTTNRAVTFFVQFGLIIALGWSLLTGPAALANVISLITHWQSALSSPLSDWSSALHNLPVFSSLPLIAANALYLVLLAAFGAAYYWFDIEVQSKLLLEAATSGKLSPLNSPIASNPGADAVSSVGGAAALAGGIATVATTSIPALLPLGPPGWALALLLGGIALVAGSEALRQNGRQKPIDHEQERRELAEVYIAEYKAKERMKFVYAGIISMLFIAYNFGVPLARGSTHH